ncbi:DUF3099 domain-containing protein [Agromyces fucosus]|jgi:hypothetical protein|uniref:DUF3099 domain-containing protein n=1 Tax=Agromyces fucosus TaxID=41985 RepID=A0A4Q2JQJ5_9MICO|nr:MULTISPECIES: DUF3099 domain-containing protein [Agromyces]RXZ50555.1 DUF3099 domain-containing protein [Agromyces fucosus]
MKQQQSITTLPLSPEAERRSRMIKYSIAMSIRVLCVIGLLFARGWWLAVFAAGAIFLPYIAVVLANVQGSGRRSTVLRPGVLMRRTSPTTPPPSAGAPGSEHPAPHDDGTRHDERGAA